MILIKTRPYNRPSYNIIKEFEDSFDNKILRVNEIESRIIKKIFQIIIKYYPDFFKRIRVIGNDDSIFCILMASHNIYKLIPASLKSKAIFLYIFDLWENEYDYFEKALRAFSVNAVFFSSLKTKNDFEIRMKDSDTKLFWLPEAVNISKYKYGDYDKKDIDILSFGRKYSQYHEKIFPFFQVNNINYLYKKGKEHIFQTEEEFINGLARAKISLCFPASETNPEYARNISKITMRYFQSMASKCLILGKKPDDMDYIFDYNPVIEADENDPCQQISSILSNYNDYIPLIERNYQEVKNKHQFTNRIASIFELLCTPQ